MTPHLWGTNRPDGPLYAGRTHIVWPDIPEHALCGLPITDLWRLRPPIPARLCPDCCVTATARLHPPTWDSPTAATTTRPHP